MRLLPVNLHLSLAFILLIPTVGVAQDKAPLTPDAAGYDQVVEPFFASFCNKCHTGVKPKGDFALDVKALPNDFLDLSTKGKWKEVVNVLNSHEMPPKKEDRQPTAKEVAEVVDWVTE